MIIDKPGFYTSKAGKCEVVAIKGEVAIGWDTNKSKRQCNCWLIETGEGIWGSEQHNITGPWIDKPKPIEAWVWFSAAGEAIVSTSKERLWGIAGDRNARLVHLIEAEDRG